MSESTEKRELANPAGLTGPAPHLRKSIAATQRKEKVYSKEVSSITSLFEASRLLSNYAEGSIISEIFTRIVNEEITGDSDDFHNISVDYSRKNQSRQALEICLVGLKTWRESIDLYADAIVYALDCADLTAATRQVELFVQNCPDRSRWNWRGFSYLCRYYEEVRPDGYESVLDTLIKDYKKYIPQEEKAYMCEASRRLSAGQYEAAFQALEEAVDKLNAPQCALKLADLYFERARYKDVIRTATLGIAYAAEPQASIRAAYLLFLRALSKDALYLKTGNTSRAELEQILKEYRLAKKYVSLREKEIIDFRIDILGTIVSPNACAEESKQ